MELFRAQCGLPRETRDRIILRASELRPSTILELFDCLSELALHPAGRRIERLEALYREVPGKELRQGR